MDLTQLSALSPNVFLKVENLGTELLLVWIMSEYDHLTLTDRDDILKAFSKRIFNLYEFPEFALKIINFYGLRDIALLGPSMH